MIPRSLARWMFAALMVASLAPQVPAAAQRAPRRPNVVFILADDAGYGDIGVQGQKRFSTPNIDRLATEGMRFTQFYAGSTVCAPSRSVLMTGKHTGHTWIRGNRAGGEDAGDTSLPDSIRTLAEVMKQAGYVTGGFGKWGLGGQGSEGDPLRQGFDRFYGYLSQTLAHRYYPETLWDSGRTVTLPGNAQGGKRTYSHDAIHEEALRFVEQNRDRPFFLYLPFTLPHTELLVPEDSVLERFRRELPERGPYRGADYDAKPFSPGGYASQPTPRAAFAAMMTRLDRSVGGLLEKLRELGLDEHTIVMFSSDNGPTEVAGADPEFFDGNGPFRGVKRDLYEGGIRVPMLVRWPGRIAPGRTSDHPGAFWDVLPTLGELAGVQAPSGIDGLSFVPALLGRPGQPTHPYLYWEFYERGSAQAVRMGRWKGVRRPMLTGRIELYDLDSDVAEKVDVASSHPEIVARLRAAMREAHTPSPFWNAPK